MARAGLRRGRFPLRDRTPGPGRGRLLDPRTDWCRPTCDVHRVYGGYGKGAKTVIASHATAKLSCRLVADEDPEAVLEGIKEHFGAACIPNAGSSSNATGATRDLGADGLQLATAARGA